MIDFERSVARNRDQYVRIAANVLAYYRQDTSLADDIVQDAIVIALEKVGTPSGYSPERGRFEAWFGRIVRNRAISLCRHLKWRQTKEAPGISDNLIASWYQCISNDGGIGAVELRIDIWNMIDAAIAQTGLVSNRPLIQHALQQHAGGVSRRAGRRPEHWGCVVNNDLGTVLSWLRERGMEALA